MLAILNFLRLFDILHSQHLIPLFVCSLGLPPQPPSSAAIPPSGSVPDPGALIGLGNAAAAATATPHQNYLSALQQHQHQEYVTAAAQRLAELQASAGLVDPLALEGRSLRVLMRSQCTRFHPGAHSLQGESLVCR